MPRSAISLIVAWTGSLIEIEGRQAAQGRQAQERACILAIFQHPAQHDLVDMGQLVITGHDHCIGIGEGRHVSRHPQAALMRGLDHCRHPVRIDRIVDLDLVIDAGIRIGVNGGDRFFLGLETRIPLFELNGLRPSMNPER